MKPQSPINCESPKAIKLLNIYLFLKFIGIIAETGNLGDKDSNFFSCIKCV